MSTGLAIATVFVYATSSALYLAAVLGEKRSWLGVAFVTLCVGLVTNAVGLGVMGWQDGVASLANIQRGLSLLAMTVGLSFVVISTVYKLRSLGSFAVPLMMLLQGLSALAEPTVTVDEEIKSTLLTVHIVSALLGSALFFMAAVTSAIYLFQERNLKRKAFGPMFQKLPSVDVLDQVNHRLIVVGFPIYTGAIGLGGFWAWESGEGPQLQLQYLFAIVSWLIYAAILHARITTGWRGKRAATLTIAGLVGIAAVLSTYVVRVWGA